MGVSREGGLSGGVQSLPIWNFRGCDREQELLLAPSLQDWLPEAHLAWFVIEAVGELDLSAFYVAYRRDG